MSRIVTFDDRMLNDALSYARCLVKKLEAMEEPTGRIEQALSLMEYVQEGIESEIAERFDSRRGTEEAYRWLARSHEKKPTIDGGDLSPPKPFRTSTHLPLSRFYQKASGNPLIPS